jgi:DNA-binding MarR family transcriptional regulator
MEDRYQALRLENQLCFPLYLCAKELVRRYDGMLSELSLTYTQYLVMMFLWERGGTNVKELSRCVMLDPSTLTPLLKKLEQKGYLTRTRSDADQRNLLLALTPAGEALRDRALCVPQRMGNCFGLTAEEAAELWRLTRKVLDNISGTSAPAAPDADNETK